MCIRDRYFNSLLMYFMESDIEDETLNLVKTTVILNVNEISLLHDLINSATQLVEDRSRLIHRDFFKLLNEKINDLIDLDNKLFDCVMPVSYTHLFVLSVSIDLVNSIFPVGSILLGSINVVSLALIVNPNS